MATRLQLFALCASATLLSSNLQAQIYRWDNGQLIPGTEGITPGPGVQLARRELAYAQLAEVTLIGSNFYFSNLTSANLTGANLAGALLEFSTLTNANFTRAVVTGAYFQETTSRGFTKEQLYSTASYQAKSLQAMSLAHNDLTGWDFSGQNLTSAHLHISTLTNANLTGANLANAQLESSTLTDANLTGAVVTGANLQKTTSRGFTKEQLYSTASYQAKTLQGIRLDYNDLSGWDFSGQNLTVAGLELSVLSNAKLTGAVVTGALFDETTSRGFTKEQLYSTASYQAKNLSEIGLGFNDLSGWEFNGQNLTRARLRYSTLTNANLTGANLNSANLWEATLTNANLTGANLTGTALDISTLTNANLTGANLNGADLSAATLTNANLTGAMVTGARFDGTTARGFTMEQLYSTASYQAKDLHGIYLGSNDLTGWDFNGQNLTNADLGWTTLTNANFSGTTSRGFTKEQLYSTASYQAKDLHGIHLGSNDLTGWDFSGQNLTNVLLGFSTLTNANLTGANLTNAGLDYSALTNANLTGANLTGATLFQTGLTNANLTGAVVTGANLQKTTSRGFTKEQLYSTASYQAKTLQGIRLDYNDLTGWDFSGQNLTVARLELSVLSNANLTRTDTRGATGLDLTGAITTNMMRPDGRINGLNLAAGEKLVAHAGVPIPVRVTGTFSIAPTATFDLTDNAAIVQSSAANKAADFARLYGYVKQGYHDGDWRGTGITSAIAAAAPNDETTLTVADNALLGYREFAGQPVTADSILLKYTYYGDIDQNGQVDADDLTVFANNFGRAAGATQIDGDIDFNGTVDADDLTVFANNFLKGVGSPLTAGPVAAVPEPSTIAMLFVGTAAIMIGAWWTRRARY